MDDACFNYQFNELSRMLDTQQQIIKGNLRGCTYNDAQSQKLIELFRLKSLCKAEEIERTVRACTRPTEPPPMRAYPQGNNFKCAYCGLTLIYVDDNPRVLRHPSADIICPFLGQNFEWPTVELKEAKWVCQKCFGSKIKATCSGQAIPCECQEWMRAKPRKCCSKSVGSTHCALPPNHPGECEGF